MPWIKIDDHFDEHPKLAAIGPVGWGVWLAGLAYSNRNLTDGFIPYAIAEGIGGSWRIREPIEDEEEADNDLRKVQHRERIWSIDIGSGMHGESISTDWVITHLVRVGLWVETTGGFLIHDYAEYQPTKAQVLAERVTKQAAGRAGGLAAAMARATAPAKAHAVAQSKPVPVPVPVPQRAYETRATIEVPDGRADLEAFLLITRRAPTPKQRRLLDELLDRHDLTGPAWAADIMLKHSDDPIGAVIAADKAWRAERIAAAQEAEKPQPKPRRSRGLPQTTRDIMAEMALLQGEAR